MVSIHSTPYVFTPNSVNMSKNRKEYILKNEMKKGNDLYGNRGKGLKKSSILTPAAFLTHLHKHCWAYFIFNLLIGHLSRAKPGSAYVCIYRNPSHQQNLFNE